jgi:hypothetical protein
MILAVTIDLDPLWCYREIYGLEPAESARAADPVTRVAALTTRATRWPITPSPIATTFPAAHRR